MACHDGDWIVEVVFSDPRIFQQLSGVPVMKVNPNSLRFFNTRVCGGAAARQNLKNSRINVFGKLLAHKFLLAGFSFIFFLFLVCVLGLLAPFRVLLS